MTHALKLLGTLAVIGAAAGVLSSCGDDVPSGAVAKVEDATISKKEFDKWLRTAATGQAQGGRAVVPDPPTFANCVAARRGQPAPRGGKKPTAGQLKKQCEQEYDQLKGEVMQFLIQAQWVQQEAASQDIKISDAEVKRRFEDEKKRAFPNDKAYQRFLRTSGMNEQDILFRIRLDTLQQKLTQKVTEKEGKVTDDDIEEYYDKNKKRFAQPERRDLNVVLTKTKGRAEQAKSALDEGQSWRRVARRYSIDEASKSQGGKLPDVTKGQQEKALDSAVFDADRGKREGPVKTQFGWYVFEVTKVTEASQQSLEQAKETIRNLLRSQRQQKALDDFIKDFREEYRDKTTCAEDFKIAECENAPKEKTGTGPASGGSPQGTPQGGVPGGAPGGAPGAPGQVPQGQAPPGAPQGGAPQGGAPQQAPQQAPPAP
jgi:foldase protein PrsA